jgi:hypothetical protein
MSFGQRGVGEGRVHIEHLPDGRYVRMGFSQMREQPDPEHGDGGVILGRVTADVGRMADRQAGDPLGIFHVVGFFEHSPGESEMGLVPEISTLSRLLHHPQPVGEIEIAHDGRF